MDNVRREILDSIDRNHGTVTKNGGQFSETDAGSAIRMFPWSPPFLPARVTRWQTVLAAFLSSRVAGSFKPVCSAYPYIGRKLAEDLLRRGLTLFTRVRKNMKALPISLEDKALLNARNMAETIIGHIKEFSSLNLSKHRSVINAFVHIIAAITAYQINPFKPKRNLQPRYRLQTTA